MTVSLEVILVAVTVPIKLGLLKRSVVVEFQIKFQY